MNYLKNSIISYTYKLIDNKYVVWIENYNQFLQLEEPAFYVFQHYCNQESKNETAKQFRDKYHLNINKSLIFVNDMFSNLDSLSVEPSSKKKYEEPKPEFTIVPYSQKKYKISNKLFSFHYESILHEHYLNPLMEHLSIGQSNVNTDFTYEIFNYKGRTFVRHNHKKILGNWDENESQYIKGAVFVQLFNDMYDKQKKDWLVTLHASAICNGKKAIAFSAASGSGKSTIAALMHAHGFELLSDDFVAVDRQKKTYLFPLASSIKEGALDILKVYYPHLEQEKSQILSRDRKGRYLTTPIEGFEPKLLRDIVFIDYNPNTPFEMSLMPKHQALQLIIDESWIQPEINNISIFLDWLSESSFYKLSYSDNNQAIKNISKLLM